MKNLSARLAAGLLILLAIHATTSSADELGEHGFAPSGAERIHFVSKGEGPLVVLIHGFPDYWYTWRNQMPKWSEKFQVVAIDQRGYNKSTQPDGVEQYAIEKLVDDVKAVVEHFKADSATIIGHDWGGFVGWSFAMKYPELTKGLVVLNIPHPWCLQRELATNPDQAANSQYARNFQKPKSHQFLTARGLAEWVKDEAAREKYVKAFERSSFEAMLNYYKANYPREPYAAPAVGPPKVKSPVLMMHGLDDQYLLASGLNETWQYVDRQLTIVTIPGAKHFVQHDESELVTDTVFRWLTNTLGSRKPVR